MTGADVVETARGWIATPYQHGASIKGVAVDCIRLIVGVGLELGIPEARAFVADPEFRGYSRQPDSTKLLAACDRYLDCATGKKLGDILVMRYEKDPIHFGFLTQEDPRYLIHSALRNRKVVEHGIDEMWANRIVRAYRFRGL